MTLTAPDGVVAFTETRERQPGSFAIPFPPVAAPPVALGVAATPPANGRWTLKVAAVDDLGQPSEMTQAFTVNTTLGFLATAPRKLFLPPGGRDLGITWKQSRPARVVVTVETPAGEVVRTLARRPTRLVHPRSSGTASIERRRQSRAERTSSVSPRRTRSGRSSSRSRSACSASSGRG